MSDADALLRFVSRLQRLEALPRIGWVVSGVARPESVAAHLYEVALLSLWIAEMIEEDVDTERVMRIALLHDVGEAVITDIPTPAKRLIGRDVVRVAERTAAATVLESAPSSWLDAVDEYNEASTIEARVVKAADTIQMLARALAYAKSGQGDLRRFFEPERSDYGIGFVRDVLDEIERLHHAGEWFVCDFD